MNSERQTEWKWNEARTVTSRHCIRFVSLGYVARSEWLWVRIQHRVITNHRQPCRRVVFPWVSQGNRFRITTPRDWLKKNSSHVFIQSKLRSKPRLSRTSFPAFRVSYVHLLGVLTGSLDCLRPLWLVRLLILVSVWRQSVENHVRHCTGLTEEFSDASLEWDKKNSSKIDDCLP